MPLDVLVEVWPPWQQPNQPVDVHNPLITDVIDYIYPIKAFVAEQVQQGVLPLWNPYVLAGYPLTYNTQAGMFYPLSLFYYLLPPVEAVDLVIFVQMMLGGAFMFGYLRLLQLRRLAALSGAILFLFNGMMVVWLEWQVVHAAVIWLPLQMYFIERAARKLRSGMGNPLIDATLAGIAFAIPWLGGHWNWTLYSSMTVAVYWLWRFVPLLVQAFRNDDRKTVKHGLAIAALTFGIGLGLSLIQVLPAFNYLRQGHRQAFSFSQSLSLGLKEWAVVGLVPDFFGNPIHKNWWGGTNYNEIAFYLGILPLTLVVLAVILRRTVTRFFALWGGLGLLWALGTPVYGILYILPVFNGLWPSRAVTVVIFCAAVLAAIGIDALMEPKLERKLIRNTSLVVAGLMLIVLAGYIWFYQPDLLELRSDFLWFGLSLLAGLALLLARAHNLLEAKPFALLLMLWLAIDLFWVGYDYNTVGNTVDLYPETETAVFLNADPEPFRITTLAEGVAYPPNSYLQDRLEAVSGYEPAILKRWVDYISAAEGENAIYFERTLMPLNGLDSPLLDAINMKYVVTINDLYQEKSTLGPAEESVDGWMSLKDTEASFSITMPDAGLHRLDIPLQAVDGAAGVVTLQLFSADGQQELAHADWEMIQPLEDGWASFYFGAFPSEWGREFLLVLNYHGEDEVAAGTSGHNMAFRAYYLPRPQLAYESGKTRVYLNEGYFPRAYVVPEAIAVQDADEALSLLRQSPERLDQVVFLELDGDELPSWEPVDGVPGEVTITDYDLNKVTMKAVMDAPGVLVLADTFYPGWRATIDGQPVPVYRANSVVRAVIVPAGTHTVTYSFWPTDFIVGAAVSGLVFLAAVGLLLYWRKREPEFA
jgi:hypothetical protein